ncbi:MAG TPA: hypothetical protein VKX17_00085 [Planctomycetota bacterium]|nr:hypothetical protein [Planctomycetota bacterium]
MPEPPRRWRFQIHLSTAIVMMFVAGGLIWANTRVHRDPCPDDSEGDRAFMEWIATGANPARGWPFTIARASPIHTTQSVENGVLMPPVSKQAPPVWFWGDLVTDVVIALGILVGVWLLCERLIRRRAARKGD